MFVSFKPAVEIVNLPEGEPAGIVMVFLSTTNLDVSLTVELVVLNVIDNVLPEITFVKAVKSTSLVEFSVINGAENLNEMEGASSLSVIVSVLAELAA